MKKLFPLTNSLLLLVIAEIKSDFGSKYILNPLYVSQTSLLKKAGGKPWPPAAPLILPARCCPEAVTVHRPQRAAGRSASSHWLTQSTSLEKRSTQSLLAVGIGIHYTNSSNTGPSLWKCKLPNRISEFTDFEFSM